MNLPWLGQIGDASVGTHQNVGWVQGALKEATLALAQVDATEGSLGKIVWLH